MQVRSSGRQCFAGALTDMRTDNLTTLYKQLDMTEDHFCYSIGKCLPEAILLLRTHGETHG